MYDESSINDPAGEVVVDRPHRGDVRCRILTVGRGGSVFGNVIADEVRVLGRLDGTVHATRFFAAAEAKVFGSINATTIGIKPGASVQGYVGPEFPVPQASVLPASTEEAILKGIEDAAIKEIEKIAAVMVAETSSPAKRAVAAAAAVARGAAPRKALPSIV